MNPREQLQAEIRASWPGNACTGCTDIPSAAELAQATTTVDPTYGVRQSSHDAELQTYLGARLDAIIVLLQALVNNTDELEGNTDQLEALLTAGNTVRQTINTKIDTANAALEQIEENTRP